MNIKDAASELDKLFRERGNPSWLVAVGTYDTPQLQEIIVYTKKKGVPVLPAQWKGFTLRVDKSGLLKPLGGPR